MTDGERRFLAMCTSIYSTSRERKRLFGCCFHPRPGFRVGKISQCACPGLTKAQHGCGGSLSSTNLQYLRATARFSSHFTEFCMVDSHVSRRCASHSPHKSSNLRAIYQYVNNRTSPKVCKNHLAGHL